MLGRLASAGLMMLAAPTALLLLVPAVLGWQRYAIVSGSMSGTYDKGSLVLDEVVPVGALKVGDVITYVGGGPVVSRSMSSHGARCTRSSAAISPRVALIRSRAQVRPWSCSDWPIVVSAGSLARALGESSQPRTET